MDLPLAYDESEVSRELKLEIITDRSWNILLFNCFLILILNSPSNALNGEGVHEGMNWLTEKLLSIQKMRK